MKRFLVVLQGDGEHYICSTVIGELTKAGDMFVDMLMTKASHGTGVIAPYPDNGTTRLVYKIMDGNSRKEFDDYDEMNLLYQASIQKYNESIT